MQNVQSKESNVTNSKIQEALDKKAKRKDMLMKVLPYTGLVFLIILFCQTTGGRFQSPENLKSILNQTYTLGIVVLGGAFLYSIGILDMSIGSVLGVSAMVMAVCVSNYNLPLWLAFVAGLAVAILCMAVTATMKVVLKVESFIASMCMMNICNGILLSVTASSNIYFPTSQFLFINNVWLKIFVLVFLYAVGLFLFNYTTVGKKLKLLGGSPTVAKLSGLQNGKVTYIAYIITAVCIAISALFMLGRTGSVDAGTGASLSLNVLTAVILGGFPLSGGAGSRYSGPLVGALTITILMNGLSLLGYADVFGYLLKGILFLIVIGLTYERSKGKMIN